MAQLIFKQLTILLWKSWVMRVRHYISSIFELIFPLVLSIIIVAIHSSATKGDSTSDMNHNSNQGLRPPQYYDEPRNIKDYTPGHMLNESNYGYMLNGSNYGHYGHKPDIYYAPNTTFTYQIMEYLNKAYDNSLSIIPFENEALLSTNLTIQRANSVFSSDVLGIVFVSDKLDYQFKYRIRLSDQLSVVDKLYPIKFTSGPYRTGSLYADNFAKLQIELNEAILEYVSHSTGQPNRLGTKVAKISSHQIPYPSYFYKGSGSGDFSFQDLVTMILILGNIVLCPLIVKRITDEKVAKAKEMLRMMGMSDWVFWISHFINYFTVMTFHSLMFTLLYFVGWGGLSTFLFSNAFLFFCIMILYSASTILSCMLLTTVFNRPIIAVVVSVVLYLTSFNVVMPFLSPQYKNNINIEATQGWRILSCFLPNVGLQWALTLMGQCENYGYGANWGNLWSTVSVYENFTIGLVMLMMLLSCFFYGFLIWYIDNVWPFQYGIPKPVYFLFMPSYWTSSKKSYSKMTAEELTQQNPSYFESEPTNTRVGISCQHLKKIFNGKQAVSDVSLNMFSGQITVLLGHNGAGKTTTMNMITGIFPPSKGTAFVDGYDIRTQTKDARRSMALCPQENILYDELNVEQHLKLYAILKDHPWNDVENEINKMLQLVALTDKKHTMSSQLSGGMKRKLSLAIAMIANSKILVLDEPTSGMDPEARRHIWDVLQSIRSHRTILLTTHYMEEADALGDRIAIMNEGLVKCCGTPMFLKKVFGAGYHLRISKNEYFNSQTVLEAVKNFMPNAEIKSEINTEIIYSLENDEHNQNQNSNTSSQLASLFDELERRSTKLGINSCGLTVTTMEDVFLRVGNECIDNELFSKAKNGFKDNGSQNLLIDSMPKNFGEKLLLQQFKALFLKRLHYAKRYWPMIILQSILPAILFMIVLLIDYSIKKSLNEDVQPLELNLNMYGNTKGFLNSNIPETDQIHKNFSEFYKKFAQNEGMNTEFIKINPNNWTLAGSNGDDIKTYIKTYLVGAQVNKTPSGLLHLIPWFNNEAYHTLPPSINFLYESLLQILVPDKKVSITVYSHPIPYNNSYSAIAVVMIGLIVCCFLMIPITVPFIGASYVLFPIHERISNSKLLQLMNGISPLIFWGASFVFDLINHLFACIFIFITFAIFDWNQVFIGQGSTRTGLFFMLFLFGFASIPLAYIVSLRLKKPSSGFAVLVIIYLVSGVILMLPLGICDLLINTFNANFMSKSTLDVILYIARFLPVFSMSFGIQKLYKAGSYQSACNKILEVFLNSTCHSGIKKSDELWGCCKNLCEQNDECYDNTNPLRWGRDGVAIEFTFLIISGFAYLIILWLIEGNFERLLYFFDSFTKPKNLAQNNTQNGLVFDVMTGQWMQKVDQEDYDVSAEKQRIEELYNRRAIHEDAIVVKDLTKTFGRLIPIQAVNRLTFGVHKEECFGLLGVNGAGKTTTFRMLTGDETVTDGNAFIDYLDLRNNLSSFQKQIGYCPQFDALLNKLTGRETLYLFARLRGMIENMIPSYVNELVEMVDLGKHVDKCTENYSGGNRRKLSLAMALCAAPPVIFLDEPTSGVDPSARRKIWSTLVRLQEKYQSAIILTSHSMEECEALCSRIAIMVNGEFKCLGSVQHLRSKFGQGFTVMAKLKRELVEQSAYLADLQIFFKQQIPSAVLKDIHQCLIHYHIPDTSVLWSHMFRIMEDIKSKYFLEDYVISDTTLEQIFLAFARSQR